MLENNIKNLIKILEESKVDELEISTFWGKQKIKIRKNAVQCMDRNNELIQSTPVSAIINNYGKIINYLPLNQKKTQYLKIDIPSELNNLFNFHKLIYLVLIIVTIIAVTIEKRVKKLQPKI